MRNARFRRSAGVPPSGRLVRVGRVYKLQRSDVEALLVAQILNDVPEAALYVAGLAGRHRKSLVSLDHSLEA